MTRFIIVAALLSSVATAQDVSPPPKPKDDGPSLADTMKFIQEKLGAIGRVNYNVAENDWTTTFGGEFTNVRASAAGCRIDFHFRYARNDLVVDDKDYWFPLRDVQEIVVATGDQYFKENDSKAGHPELSSRVDPSVFFVTARRKNEENSFVLYDESMANRIAKALVHAVELCGGGNKDPF